MNVVDLFAGPGGWDAAARQLGHHPLGVELDDAACATRKAANLWTLQADVAAIDPVVTMFPHFGIGWREQPLGLIGSPPCPSFSTAGKRLGRNDAEHLIACAHELAAGNDTRAEHAARCADERSILSVEPLRWALALRPRWIALEQVPAVLGLWTLFAGLLETVGYRCDAGVLTAEQYGTPQTRRRAFLVASLDGPVTLPAPTHEKFRKGKPLQGSFGLKPWVSMSEALAEWSEDDLVGFPRLLDSPEREAVTIGDKEYRARDFRRGDEPAFAMTEKVRSWRRYYRSDAQAHAAVRAIGEPAPTLKFAHASLDAGWVPEREARVKPDGVPIAPAEASVLMGFRADYPWQGSRTKQFEQIGNAVPPPLGQAVLAAAMAHTADRAREAA